MPLDGGSINWLLNTYGRFDPNEIVFVADQCEGSAAVDLTLPFRVERVGMKMSDWDPTLPVSLYRYIQILRYIKKSCKEHGIKQIHCAKVLPEGCVAWGLNFFNSIPYILYAHGEEITVGFTSRKLSWLLPKIYNGASAIIANSGNTKKLLEGIGISQNKIHVIHPGVDAASFIDIKDDAGEIIRKRHNLGISPVILTVGRLQQRKGHDAVIRALLHIKQEFQNVKYLIVGTGEEADNLRHMAHDMGVASSVIFVGRVSNKELAGYYAASDLFIMPNRQIGADIEGFGMVYLEAGAAGKPVIGGISGGTSDAIHDGVTGLRVNGESVLDIADAVTSILSNPKKAKEMGENGRRRAEKEFTWEAVIEKTREISHSIQAK